MVVTMSSRGGREESFEEIRNKKQDWICKKDTILFEKIKVLLVKMLTFLTIMLMMRTDGCHYVEGRRKGGIV